MFFMIAVLSSEDLISLRSFSRNPWTINFFDWCSFRPRDLR